MRKLFLLAIVLCVWSVVADAQESERRYIEVTGSSEIEVVPDEIHPVSYTHLTLPTICSV